MQDVIDQVNADLKKSRVSTYFLSSRLTYTPESIRSKIGFSDPKYYPLYYHLGKYISPKNVLDLSFEAGVASGCFLISNNTTESFLGFQKQKNDHYTPTFGRNNIKAVGKTFHQADVYVGNLEDEEFINKLDKKWDLVIINKDIGYDEVLTEMKFIWKYISDGGHLILDFCNSDKGVDRALPDFARIMNREYLQFKSKYKAAIIKK